MKNSLPISILLLLGSSIILSSCKEEGVINGSSEVTPKENTPLTPLTPPPTGGCQYGSGTEAGVAESADQTLEYYKLNSPMPTVHGAGLVGGNQVVFSTETDLPSHNQKIFESDDRFNVRIIPRYKYGGVDSKGVNCGYVPRMFTKMKFGVVVRSRQNSPGIGDYRTVSDVAVNCPSQVYKFQVDKSSPDPHVIDILEVQWDHACIDYENQGFPNHPGFCPYANIPSTECYSFEIQFATDKTKNFPVVHVK